MALAATVGVTWSTAALAAPITHACTGATFLWPLPTSCEEALAADPTPPPTDTPECYTLSGMTLGNGTWCERTRIAVVLLNNEQPDPSLDEDGDGISDDADADGFHDLSGANSPADPDVGAVGAHDTALIHATLEGHMRDWFGEASYGRLVVDIDLFAKPGGHWYRYVWGKPGWANWGVLTDVCGDHAPDFTGYNIIAMARSGPTGDLGGACDMLTENVPDPSDCVTAIALKTNYMWVKNFNTFSNSKMGTFVHEIGHALPGGTGGLGHSSHISSIDGEVVEYGDLTDTMGAAANRGHFSVKQKLRLDWLEATHVDLVDTATTSWDGTVYALARNEDERKGVKVELASGESYYVEARRDGGTFDGNIPGILREGVMVKRVSGGGNEVVDATKETPTKNSKDSALLPHRVYSDPDEELYISVVDATADWAEVAVRRGPFLPANTRPTISGVACAAGVDLTCTATATDDDPEAPLYFWRIGTDATYDPTDFAWGASMTTSRVGDRVVLVVSDRRGGVTLAPAWPLSGGVPVNSAPVFVSATAERLQPSVNCASPKTCRRFRLTAEATDADGDLVLYQWTVDGVDQQYPEPIFATTTAGEHTVDLAFSDLMSPVLGGTRTLHTTRRWTEVTGAQPAARRMHAMAYDADRGEVVMFGGRDGGGVLAPDTCLFDGAAWSCSATATDPGGRTRHAMADAYDGDGAYLFGGLSGGSYQRDLWHWDGTDWTDLTPGFPGPAWPAARGNAAMVATDGELVVFGGENGLQVFDDLRVYDGAWYQVPQVGPWPAARQNAVMAWDPEQRVVLMYGGVDLAGNQFEDTWLLDVDTGAWDEVSATSAPGVLDRAGLVYDPIGRRFVLFGGRDGVSPTFTSAVWELDGDVWLDVTPALAANVFTPRDVKGFAYDAANQEVVLFGGFDGSVLGDTWVHDVRYYIFD